MDSSELAPLPAEADMPREAREASYYSTRVLGGFVLVQDLGRGPRGTVHKAWDLQARRWVALKLMRTGAVDAESLERFRLEAATVASLDHPYIAPVLDVLEVGGRSAIVMKFIEGRTLEQEFHQDPLRATPIGLVVRHIRDAALGLGYAHGRGLVHGNLKPGNLMVGPRNRLYVLDFGLAKILSRSETRPDLGPAPETPAYMSPEQVMDPNGEVDARSDVFSLGATLWALMAGRPPFQGRTDREVARAILRDPTPSVRGRRTDIPEGLDLVLQTAMEKDPGARYPSGTEFASALNGCLASLESAHASWVRYEPIAAPFGPPPVFMIEDDLAVAGLVREALAMDGLEVVHEADGTAAMGRAREIDPGVVLLDLNLPGTSGWEILRTLRSLPSYEKVPILIVTGEGSEASVVRAFHLGADDYIVKPFSVAVLRARVRRQVLRRTVEV
ncbi:MAG TPA: protein kinase [Planctomycetota bacterium]